MEEGASSNRLPTTLKDARATQTSVGSLRLSRTSIIQSTTGDEILKSEGNPPHMLEIIPTRSSG